MAAAVVVVVAEDNVLKEVHRRGGELVIISYSHTPAIDHWFLHVEVMTCLRLYIAM